MERMAFRREEDDQFGPFKTSNPFKLILKGKIDKL